MNKVICLSTIIFSLFLIFTFESVFADESIEVEVFYTNGDRADFNSMKLVVYQDFDKSPFIIKDLENNPDVITVPENHRYKIEVYANGMYGDVGYVQLNENPEKINIHIPISGGILFETYYDDGLKPIEDAIVILKSHDNSEWGKGLTNDQGETNRFWIQSTVKQEDHYIADVYLEDLYITSSTKIKVEPGSSKNLKIITNIPETIEELVTINLNAEGKQITSSDGNYKVTLNHVKKEITVTSNVNFRGDAQFSNLKSGTYDVIVTTDDEDENMLWPQNSIHLIGDLNQFDIFRYDKKIIANENPFLSCNCISFRLDDVQDYWLSDTQIELIELFSEKNIPLTIGVIGSLIGADDKLVSTIQENIENENIEIANHSWNNDALVNLDSINQEQYIQDTNNKISELFGVVPKYFVPPQNLYDQQTIDVLKKNNFTHLVSHIEENDFTYVDKESFNNIPATTETGILLNDYQWKLHEKEFLKEKIIQSVNQRGYAIVMMHPQEFSLNENNEYDIPNQKSLSELALLLDELSVLDSKMVKISEIEPVIESIDEQLPQLENNTDSCDCVSFRLDGVQDYWLNDVQLEIMKTFVDNGTPLTVGIIANAFGNDQKITEYVSDNANKNGKYLEIATKGMGLTSFTEYDKNEQNQNLKESLEIIEAYTDIKSQVFIPPNNKFNSDTFGILDENDIIYFSSSLINGDSPPFEFKDQEYYRFPQISATGKYNPSSNLFEGVSNKLILLESVQGIQDYGFSVISIQPQEFSNVNNSTYVNSVNQDQINELKKLIEGFNKKGIKIVHLGEINSNLRITVPEWIKNNAGWWADGSIDDETFVQGIEYLVKEEIINVTEQSKNSISEQNIPKWIKNNAGWWADGSIDDETFVQGIEYLVKIGIILY